MAGPSLAEPNDRVGYDKPTGQTARDGTAASRPIFVPGSKFKGMDIYNSADETLGEIDDLVIDRGSGRIAYVVLSTGTVLGMGGKLIAAPYSSFNWDNMDKHVLLNSTPEQIKAWPEYNKDRWSTKNATEPGLDRTLSNQYYQNWSSESSYPMDKNRNKADQQVRGRIKSIDRESIANGPEEIIVTVVSDDNTEHRVAVGPSWYLAGNTVQFYRDTPVEMRVMSVDRNGRQTMLARSASINSKSVDLYDDNGRAYWGDNTRTTDRQGNRIYPALMLGSEIMDKKVDCRGEQCGEVDDLIIECSSGRVAFLSIDPDQNTLGIGDTNRLVPWGVVMGVRNDRLLVDADKTMVVNAKEAPSDTKMLNDWYRDAYKPYGVNAPTFERNDWRSDRTRDDARSPRRSDR